MYTNTIGYSPCLCRVVSSPILQMTTLPNADQAATISTTHLIRLFFFPVRAVRIGIGRCQVLSDVLLHMSDLYDESYAYSTQCSRCVILRNVGNGCREKSIGNKLANFIPPFFVDSGIILHCYVTCDVAKEGCLKRVSCRRR